MHQAITFGLIHSPLVGSFSWALVARSLQEGGYRVITPELVDNNTAPYWPQHVQSAGAAINSALSATNTALILVGHSGAGPLLPAIAQAANCRTAGYIFVDAGLPHPAKSRLAEMAATSPEFARELHNYLSGGGCFPDWSNELLVEILPDEKVRQRLLAEVRPRPLAYFEEILPVTENWPDNSAAYVLFSPAYATYLNYARERGWPWREFEAGHFHLLVEPEGVSQAIIELGKTLVG